MQTDYHHEHTLRQQIVDIGRRMDSIGLNQGTSASISVRLGQQLLITPSGVAGEQPGPEDISSMRLDNHQYHWQGPHKPSSEWHFHRGLLQRYDQFNAVIHSHSTYATVLAIAGRKIPAVHYRVAAFGGHTVRCADYATFGSKALTRNILKAMKNRSGCLLANHGMLVAGDDLDHTLRAAVELEALARHYYLASKQHGMQTLSKKEIRRVLHKFSDYGRAAAKISQTDGRQD